MREKASVDDQGFSYRSLMDRLAEVDGSDTPPAPRESEHRAERSRQRIIRTYFGLGFAGSGVVGCIGLLVLSVHSDHAYTGPALAAPDAATAWVPAGQAPATRAARSGGRLRDAPAAATFDLAIRNAERGHFPFALNVTGAPGAGQDIKVLVRDVPETAILSKGTRQDEHTWALAMADLEGLHLVLGEGTPEAFAMTIEVTPPAGAVPTRAIARVRLVDDAAAAASDRADQEIAATSIDQLLARSPDRPPPALVTSPAAVHAWDTSTSKAAGRAPGETTIARRAAQPASASTTVKLSAADKAAPVPNSPRPPPLEGASGLGALTRETPADSRQVWWKMPTPDWSPFTDAPGRR